MNKIGKVISWLLVVLLIIGIAGGIAYFALRSQGVTFYAEYGEKKYYSNLDSENLCFVCGDSAEFSVKSLEGKTVDFTVKITSNPDNNFYFTVRNEFWHLWNGDEEKDDYSEIFGLEQDSDGFTVTTPLEFTVQKAVEEKYGGEIELSTELPNDLCYFMIVVSAGKSELNIPFYFLPPELTVTLDSPSIIF